MSQWPRSKECGAIDQVLRSVRFALAPATGPYRRIYAIGAMTVLELWLAMASAAHTPKKVPDISADFLYTVRSGEHQSGSLATGESHGNQEETRVRGEVADALSEVGVSPLPVI